MWKPEYTPHRVNLLLVQSARTLFRGETFELSGMSISNEDLLGLPGLLFGHPIQVPISTGSGEGGKEHC